MNRRLVVSIVLIVALLLAAAGICALLILTAKSPPKRAAAPIVQRVVAPPVAATTDYVVQVAGYGSVRAAIRLDLAPLVAGQVLERSAPFLSGHYVQAGDTPDVLFQIDPVAYKLKVDAAAKQVSLLRARLDRLDQDVTNIEVIESVQAEKFVVAEQQLQRMQTVFKSQAGSTDELERARSDMLTAKIQLQTVRNKLTLAPKSQKQLEIELELAQVDLEMAQLNLKRTTVTAPVTGRIIRCNVEAGEHVNIGQVCGELYSTDVMEIPVSIPARDLQWLDVASLNRRNGSQGESDSTAPSAATVLWTEPGTEQNHHWTGTIDRLEAGLQAGTRTAVMVVVVSNIDENTTTTPAIDEGRSLLDINMYCKVVVDGRRLPRVFVLPRRAVQGGDFVYLVEDGRLTTRAVDVARYADDEVLILPGGGINEGDRVVLSYVPKPVRGMTVEAVDSADEPTE